MVSLDHYQHELHSKLQQASKRGAKSVVVTAEELNQAVGGSAQYINNCLEALHSAIGPNDDVLIELDRGPDFAVRFTLPRSDH